MTASICAFTSVCQEDACWVSQYLREAERLEMPFAIHLDRIGDVGMARRLAGHPLCVGQTAQDNIAVEFDETHKQGAFDLVDTLGFMWAMAWDIDETYERGAPRKLAQIGDMVEADYVDIVWLNLWGDQHHVRTDGPFASGHRVKFYNLDRARWRFTHPVTNGAKRVDDVTGEVLPQRHPAKERAHRHDLVCLHWGMMTRELREQHKLRWDRIYTTAVGANPYGFWDYAIDEATHPPTVERHDYLP